jgi:hypothetical protein
MNALKQILSHSAWVLLVFISMSTQAQSGFCDPGVPFFQANLSASPSMVWTSPQSNRSGYCCGVDSVVVVPPPRCIEFEVTLHPGAVV